MEPNRVLMKNGQKLYSKIEKKKQTKSKSNSLSLSLTSALPQLEKEFNLEKRNSLRLTLLPKKGQNVLYKNQPKIKLLTFQITQDEIAQLKIQLTEKLEQKEFYSLAGENILICRYQCWLFMVPPNSIQDYSTWQRRDCSEFASVYHDFVRVPLIPKHDYYHLWNNNPKNDKHARGKILKHISLLYEGKTSKGQPLKNLNTLTCNFSAGELVLIELNYILRPFISLIPIYDDLNRQLEVLESVIRYYGDKSTWEEWDNLINKMYDLYLDIITTENTFFISRRTDTQPQISIDEQKCILHKYCISRQNRIRFNLIASSNYPHESRLYELVSVQCYRRDIFFNLELTNGKNKIKIEWEEFANRINSRHTMEIPAKKEQRNYIRMLVNKILNMYAQLAQSNQSLFAMLVERGFYYHNNFVGSISLITGTIFNWALLNKEESMNLAIGWEKIYSESHDEVLESGLFGKEFLENIQLLEEMHSTRIRSKTSIDANRTIEQSFNYVLPIPLYIQTPNDRKILYKRLESYLQGNKIETIKRVLTFMGIRVDLVEDFDGGLLIYLVGDPAIRWLDKVRCVVTYEGGELYVAGQDKFHLLRKLKENNAIIYNLSDPDNLCFNLSDLIVYLDNNNQAVYFDEQIILDLPTLEIPPIDY